MFRRGSVPSTSVKYLMFLCPEIFLMEENSFITSCSVQEDQSLFLACFHMDQEIHKRLLHVQSSVREEQPLFLSFHEKSDDLKT